MDSIMLMIVMLSNNGGNAIDLNSETDYEAFAAGARQPVSLAEMVQRCWWEDCPNIALHCPAGWEKIEIPIYLQKVGFTVLRFS